MKNIDMHLKLILMLSYYTDFGQWKVARLLNRHAKSIVDSKPYIKERYGRSTFIRTEWCCTCEKSNPNVAWLRYDELGRPNYITHCRTWFCRVSSLHSMIEDCRDHGRVLLRVPWKTDPIVTIPRSDGTHSHGHCKINSLVVKNDKYYVETEWSDLDGQSFAKLVPLEYYSPFLKPEIMCI